MDAPRKEKLMAGGINVKEALDRMMGSEKILEKYLGRFPEEKSYAELKAAMENNDEKAAAAAVHTFKSVCGTLGCQKLQELVIDQEKSIRSGDWEAAQKFMPAIQAEYQRLCELLQS